MRGFAMGSFEWMELQTLTSDINASRSRLAQARSSKDHRLIRLLEAEIAAAEARRDRLLAHITTHLADDTEPAADVATMKKAADLVAAVPAAEKSARDDDGGEEPSRELVASPGETGAASAAPAREAGGVKGGSVVWDQLTPSDLERAQRELGVRRAEMLTRHAEELKALEGDQSELEALEQAIAAFVRRFNPSAAEAVAEAAAEASIVKLGEERELRVQGRG